MELGGAVKNVIAIAAGVCTGHWGWATTPGRAGHSRPGGNDAPRRGAGRAGGDSRGSGRARRFRRSPVPAHSAAIAAWASSWATAGSSAKYSRASRMVAEGVSTTAAVWTLARRHAVSMPITEQMHAVLYEDRSPRDAIRELMSRPLKNEYLPDRGNAVWLQTASIECSQHHPRVPA